VSDGHIHPALVVWLLAAGAFYLACVRRVHATRSRRWPARRSAAFAAGIAVALAGVASPLAAQAEIRLADHMVQHLLLMLVAAPLLVAGAPLSLALQALRGRPRERLAAAVRSRPVRVLAHPLVAFSVFAAATVATHLTGFYDLAVRDGGVHLLEHAIYLASALLFWLPVVGTNPVPQLRTWITRTIYLILAMPPMSAVAVVLLYAETPRYPSYVEAARAHGFSALLDQQDGAAIMWVAGSMAMVAASVAIGWQALVREERRQRAIDALEAGT
jgi:putative copper resistance protein D